MRAIGIEAFGGAEKLRPMALPRPRPDKGEILIRVVAAGVNPVDGKIREGRLCEVLPHRFPLVPGWDAAGVVEEFGEGASGFRKGDRVWALAKKSVVQWGCYAEYVSVPQEQVALMPRKLLFEEAAAVPLAALAARQCLFRVGRLAAGATLLIHGAAGGVGHFAIQLAKQAGVRVIGTAGPANQPFILGLGADAGIDYTREDFREALGRHAPEGADMVLDTVGGETLERSLKALKRGGTLVSLVDEADAAAAEAAGVTARFHTVIPIGDELQQLGRLFDQKTLKVHVQKIYSLSKAAEAQRAVDAGHTQGKIVLNL